MLTILRLCALASVFGVVLSEGLLVKKGEPRWLLQHPGLLVRAVLAVLVLVPVAAWLVTRVFQPEPRVAIGLAILAAAPLCPLVFQNLAKLEPHRAFAHSLHLVLAAVAVITTPLTLAVLGSTLGLPMRVPVAKVVGQLLFTVVAPMGLGMLLRARAPALADRLRRVLQPAALGLLGAIFLLLVVTQLRVFAAVGLRGYLAMIAFVVLALAIGHTLGGRTHSVRATLALESATRSPPLAVAIAAVNFLERSPAGVLLPYVLCLFVVSAIYVKAAKGRSVNRRVPARARRREGARG